MTRTKGLPNFTISQHTPTGLLLRTTRKKIIRPVASIPNRRWNMPSKLFSGRKKLTGSPSSQRTRRKVAWTRDGDGIMNDSLGLDLEFDGREIVRGEEATGPK